MKTSAVVRLVSLIVNLILVYGLGSSTGEAQVSQLPVNSHDPTEFDVASVRENKSGGTPSSNIPLDRSDAFTPTGGTFRAIGQPFIAYLIFAYKVKVSESRGGLMRSLPSWAVKDRFDIVAKSAAANATKDEMRLMLQSLLAERFKLKVHREDRQFSVLALYPMKTGFLGPQLKAHDSNCASSLATPARSIATAELLGRWPSLFGDGQESHISRKHFREGGRAMTMDQIADWLDGAGDLESPVVNRSGLKGSFDFVLEFVPEKLEDTIPNPSDAEQSGPSFQEALQDQLGMRLCKEKAAIRLFFVDHVEYPSPN